MKTEPPRRWHRDGSASKASSPGGSAMLPVQLLVSRKRSKATWILMIIDLHFQIYVTILI